MSWMSFIVIQCRSINHADVTPDGVIIASHYFSTLPWAWMHAYLVTHVPASRLALTCSSCSLQVNFSHGYSCWLIYFFCFFFHITHRFPAKPVRVCVWGLRVCTCTPLSSTTLGTVCDEHAEAYANTDNNQPLPNSLPNGTETRYLLLVTLMVTKNMIEEQRENLFSR